MTNITIAKKLTLNNWQPIERLNSEGYVAYTDWKKSVKDSGDECFLIEYIGQYYNYNCWEMVLIGHTNYSTLKRIYDLFTSTEMYEETRRQYNSIFIRNAFDAYLLKITKLLVFI